MNHLVSKAVRRCFILLAISALSSANADERAHAPIPLWTGDVPLENSQSEAFQNKLAELEKQNTDDRIRGVSKPDLTIRLADKSSANGTAVLVCPGGGYNILAWEKEGLEVADWLNSIGVHAFVLQYRVPRREPDFKLMPLQDAQRAMRIIRAHADEWNIDTDKVGVLGFSAGGHLSVNLALSKSNAYTAADSIDEFECRPNFMIPVYAAYLGAEDNDQSLNPQLAIDSQTPPAFFVVTQDDKNRGIHAALMFAELTRAGIPAEVHVFTKGGHGYGLRPTHHPVQHWPDQCAEWMRQMQLIPPRD